MFKFPGFCGKPGWDSKFGFKRRKPHAARYSGVNIRMVTILVFAASGAIAGIAGFSEVTEFITVFSKTFPLVMAILE
ncbi:MAG: hypothetical protein CM1200mP30_03390 [Pseudomonadota bacterium]|nr:MAG: hypothetical protein CM1200mP30_03390 [Pseudomonadota bacterium]